MKVCLNPNCSLELSLNKKSPNQKYCNRKCWSAHREFIRTECSKKCDNTNCNNIIKYKKGTDRKFCSISCSATVTNSISSKRRNVNKLAKIAGKYFNKSISNVSDTDIDKFSSIIIEFYKIHYNIKKVMKLMNITSTYIKECSNIIKSQNISKPIMNNRKRKSSKRSTSKNTVVKKTGLCAHCGAKVEIKRRKYCKFHQHMYSNNGKALFKFTFNVNDYPDLLNLSLIDKYGWYSPGGGKCSLPKNINGVSRDHKVSINEAIKNGYDPYYIKHPCNCELMLHSDNYKKKTKSSITYEELISTVLKYEISRAQQT